MVKAHLRGVAEIDPDPVVARQKYNDVIARSQRELTGIQLQERTP